MPYRDQVPRVSIAQVRARFTRRAFKALTAVRLEIEGQVTEVAIVLAAGSGSVRSARRWFQCPECARCANVLGLLAGERWGCRLCGRWRSRNTVVGTQQRPAPLVA